MGLFGLYLVNGSPLVSAQSQSSDATLSSLTLSDVDFGTFASATTTYTASVASTVTETTVTPTANHSGASYVIKLGGVADDDGQISLGAGSNVVSIEVTAEDGQTTQTYTVTVTRTASTDATLSDLTLSDVTIRNFSSETARYFAYAAYRVTQTTVTPTLGDSRASYVIKLGGVEDADGVVSLARGWNEITVEVTAEDGATTETYTVRVFRYDPGKDGTLVSLSLSGVDIGWGHHGVSTRSYSGSAAYSLTETTVDPYVLSGDTYVIKLDGVEDDDGVIPLATGDNIITVEVTSYDGQRTNTYTITVTRAATASTDATLDGLAMSGIDLGVGVGRGAYWTSLEANIYHSISETTVTPETNHPFATYVIKLGGVEDADGEISLAEGSNVITVEVTAEDGTTTKTYTATINRAAADDPTTGVLSTDDPPMNLRVLHASPSYIQLGLAFPRNRGITAWETQRYHHNGTEFVSSGSAHSFSRSGDRDNGGSYTTAGTGLGPGPNPTRGALYKYVVTFKNSEGSTVIEESITVRVPSYGRSIFERQRAQSTESQQADATLSDLTLTGMAYAQDRGGTICCGINRGEYITLNPEQHAYEGKAPNSLSQLTVTPALSQSGASYVIKKGGVTDDDGTVPLDLGTNFITIEVTAPDETHFRTYYLTITRVEAGSATDATLSGLTLSGIDFGSFASATTSYAVTVADTVSNTTVTPTLNDSNASYQVRRDDSLYSSDSPTVRLYKGTNDITVMVFAEDDATTKTYTVSVARGQTFLVGGVTSSNVTENDATFKQWHWAKRNERAIWTMDVTWSLTGDDSDDFSIAEADDGTKRAVLAFTSAPDYENPTDADTDNVYEVTVNASDGTNTITKDVKITVTDVTEEPNSPATGAPTISGTVQVGHTLTAGTSGIADTNGLTGVSYSYQWLADDTEIGGATSLTYTLQASDNGKVIKVQLTFTDDEGNDESLTSAGTSAVVALTVSGITATDYAENGTAAVATYAVTGASQAATITWSLTGSDNDDFSISNSGVLTFSSSPDYETPTDSDTDNIYEVTVNASDGTVTETLDVTVTVTDLNEAPVLNGN